ncbi:MAG: helix-turn-helix domain-containing protein, partial [bacterium]|nr:helix-turn-helix domain-containing protein [bacterium]
MNRDKNEKNFSEFLRELRQKKNFSLEKLSELTKIQIYHLEAIEAGQFEKLPPSVYRDGIFKRLSKFLDIDESEILEAYRNKFESKTSTISLVPAYSNYSFFILTRKKLMVFVGMLFLTLLFGYLWYQFNFLTGPPNLVIKPSEDMVTQEESILIIGKTDGGINLTINGENTY